MKIKLNQAVRCYFFCICLFSISYSFGQNFIKNLDELTPGGVYQITNAFDQRALCTLHNSKDENYKSDHEKTIIFDAGTDATHYWEIRHLPNGNWRILNLYRGQALGTMHNIDSNFSNNWKEVILFDAYGGQSQEWKIEDLGNNEFVFTNVQNNQILSTHHDGTDPSYKGNQEYVVLKDNYNSRSQKWKISPKQGYTPPFPTDVILGNQYFILEYTDSQNNHQYYWEYEGNTLYLSNIKLNVNESNLRQRFWFVLAQDGLWRIRNKDGNFLTFKRPPLYHSGSFHALTFEPYSTEYQQLFKVELSSEGTAIIRTKYHYGHNKGANVNLVVKNGQIGIDIQNYNPTIFTIKSYPTSEPPGAGWIVKGVSGNIPAAIYESNTSNSDYYYNIDFYQIGPFLWEEKVTRNNQSVVETTKWHEYKRDEWSVYLKRKGSRPIVSEGRHEELYAIIDLHDFMIYKDTDGLSHLHHITETSYTENENTATLLMLSEIYNVFTNTVELSKTGNASWQLIFYNSSIIEFRVSNIRKNEITLTTDYIFFPFNLKIDLETNLVFVKLKYGSSDWVPRFIINDSYGLGSPMREDIITFPGTYQSLTLDGFLTVVKKGGLVIVKNKRLKEGECNIIYPKASYNQGLASAEYGLLTCAIDVGDGVKLEMIAIHGGCDIPTTAGIGSGLKCETGVFSGDMIIDLGNGNEAKLNVTGPAAEYCSAASSRLICAGGGVDLASTSFQITDDKGNGMGMTLAAGIGAGVDAAFEDGTLTASVDLKILAGGSITISADLSEVDLSDPASAVIELAEVGFAIRNNTVSAVTSVVKNAFKDILGEDVAVVPNTIIYVFFELPWKAVEWFLGLF